MRHIKWYTSLKASEDVSKRKSLLESETYDSRSLIVCQQLENRYFAIFLSFLEFGRYAKLHVKDSHCCFYEVILGNMIQKPYFDLDIPIKSVDPLKPSEGLSIEEAQRLRDQVYFAIMDEFTFINPSDIMDCTSHSEAKRSHHIVVDNWCVRDNEENRIFCQKVISRVDSQYHRYIDSTMYKSVQQLRIMGSHKWESPRVKILDLRSRWKHPTQPTSENHRFILELGGSLITNVSHCQFVPNMKPLVEKAKFTSDAVVFNEGDVDKCLALCASKGGTTYSSPTFPYVFGEVKPPLILLKRKMASMCQICERIHEAENPYLVVIGKHRHVYFHCRRAPIENKLYLGSLGRIGEFDSVIPEASQSESAIPSLCSLKLVYAETLPKLELTSQAGFGIVSQPSHDSIEISPPGISSVGSLSPGNSSPEVPPEIEAVTPPPLPSLMEVAALMAAQYSQSKFRYTPPPPREPITVTILPKFSIYA